MRFAIELHYTDYNREGGYTKLTVQDAGTFAQVEALAVAYANVVSGLSSGFNTHALIRAKIALGNEHPAAPTSNVERRALLICKQGERYGTFTVPSPTSFPTVPSGPLRNSLASKAPSPAVSSLQTLVGLLASTVLPDGSPFPAGDWQYLLMEP